jgi:putative acetyltransferase
MLLIRAEEPADTAAIHRVHAAAFPTDAEARLVDALRGAGRLTFSLVALKADAIVAHIAFSPVEIGSGAGPAAGMGLAPLAVLPEHQRRGIGSRLVREGLEACKNRGVGFVVVLGEPAYYQRFGFTRATNYGLINEYGALEEFMALEMYSAALSRRGGLVKFAAEFAALR